MRHHRWRTLLSKFAVGFSLLGWGFTTLSLRYAWAYSDPDCSCTIVNKTCTVDKNSTDSPLANELQDHIFWMLFPAALLAFFGLLCNGGKKWILWIRYRRSTSLKSQTSPIDNIYQSITEKNQKNTSLLCYWINCIINCIENHLQELTTIVCFLLEILSISLPIVEIVFKEEEVTILAAVGSWFSFALSTVTLTSDLQEEVDIGEALPAPNLAQSVRNIFLLLLCILCSCYIHLDKLDLDLRSWKQSLFLTQGLIISGFLLFYKRQTYLRDQLESKIMCFLLFFLVCPALSLISAGFTNILPVAYSDDGKTFSTHSVQLFINGLLISILFCAVQEMLPQEGYQSYENVLECSMNSYFLPTDLIFKEVFWEYEGVMKKKQKYIVKISQEQKKDNNRAYSEVFKGEIRSCSSNNEERIVWVKKCVLYGNPAEILHSKIIEKEMMCLNRAKRDRQDNIASFIGGYYNGGGELIGITTELFSEKLESYIISSPQNERNGTEKLDWARQLAGAIWYCHSQLGIILNCIDPLKIAVVDETCLKLYDFENAIFPGERTETPSGRINYWAPELLRCREEEESSWSYNADVYSYGLLLYAIYYRKRITESYNEENKLDEGKRDKMKLELYKYIQQRNRPCLYDDNDVSEDIKKTIHRCWSFDSESRHSTRYLQ